MTDDREVFKVRREAGLQKRHEKRLESATYTAAEVKVLTEAALRLGRREAGEEIAQEILAAATRYVHPTQRDIVYDMERLARHVASKPSPDTTSGRTDPGDRCTCPPHIDGVGREKWPDCPVHTLREMP